MARKIGAFAVWYYGVIVRGPFATRILAMKAIRKIRHECTCDYPSLKIGQWDSQFNAQRETWTHPSVLAMAGATRERGIR